MSLRRWLAASARTCSESTYSAVRSERDGRGAEGGPLSLEEDVEARRIGRERILFAERQRRHIECGWRKKGNRCGGLGRIRAVAARGPTQAEKTLIGTRRSPNSGQSFCDLRTPFVPP